MNLVENFIYVILLECEEGDVDDINSIVKVVVFFKEFILVGKDVVVEYDELVEF